MGMQYHSKFKLFIGRVYSIDRREILRRMESFIDEFDYRRVNDEIF